MFFGMHEINKNTFYITTGIFPKIEILSTTHRVTFLLVQHFFYKRILITVFCMQANHIFTGMFYGIIKIMIDV